MSDAIEERTISVNGIDMHVELRGSGEPLVLLHGFFGRGDDWRHVFDLMDLAQRYRVIIPDLRGHGRTTNPTATFSHGQCAADVAGMLDELGVSRCRAIGLSLGGGTLLHLATRASTRVAAMVIVSCPTYFPAPARAIMAQASADTQSPAEWDSQRAKHAGGDGQIRALFAHARAFAASHEDMAFTPPLLATIQTRTLVVYGDRDPFYPVEMAVEMYRAIPNGALSVVPGGGHGPIFAPGERESFARAALAFVEGQEP
jgi:pimeloyl-ACP methyl ester carboxylesterase